MRWQIVYLLRDFVVAPHTFVKPKSLDTARSPELGEPAPALPGVRAGRPAVVGFLRHVGCPFAEATLREMTTLAAAHPEVDFIAVTHSDEAPSQRWCDAFGGAGAVRIVPDPERARYAAWGVGLSDRRHFAGPESLAALRRLLDRGIHNRWARGNRWQAAASFAIDAAGMVRWRHRPRHAGDVPALGEAISALAA
jgi:hypothetical protein